MRIFIIALSVLFVEGGSGIEKYVYNVFFAAFFIEASVSILIILPFIVRRFRLFLAANSKSLVISRRKPLQANMKSMLVITLARLYAVYFVLSGLQDGVEVKPIDDVGSVTVLVAALYLGSIIVGLVEKHGVKIIDYINSKRSGYGTKKGV